MNLNHLYKEIYLLNKIFIRFSSNLILRKNNVKEYYNCLPLFFWSQTLFSIAFGGTKSIRRKMPNWPTSTTLSESKNSLSSSVPVESVISPSHSFCSPLWMLAKLQLPTWHYKVWCKTGIKSKLEFYDWVRRSLLGLRPIFFLEWGTVVNIFKWGEGWGRLVIDKGLYYDTVTHRIQLNY